MYTYLHMSIHIVNNRLVKLDVFVYKGDILLCKITEFYVLHLHVIN